ncbi:aminopeptidase N-like [Actinia tenebrosa]|uniref:Aminopeptidase N-like n=1 Tax=Actinia tenebrosa TaxID=6105 RepID=A0A6P8HWU7_ACTTE|nr:aminopeptidase N-like [Actinia tenebrosa]
MQLIVLYSITPALRQLVYYYGVRQGDQKDWQKVLEAVQTTTVPSEIQPLLMGLAGSSKEDALLNYLKLGQNQSIVKQQFAKYMYDFVANRNPVGHKVALNFILPRADLMGHLPVVSKRFSTTYRMQQLKDYIEKNLNGEEMLRQFKKALELVRLNGAWLEAHEKDLANWLDWYTVKYNLAADDGLYE